MDLGNSQLVGLKNTMEIMVSCSNLKLVFIVLNEYGYLFFFRFDDVLIKDTAGVSCMSSYINCAQIASP